MKTTGLNFLKRNNGFTLVELLVVIVILAILTSIAIPSYAIVKNRARESATKTEMNNIARALDIYISENQSYPAEDDFPDALIAAGIMESFIANDAWGTSYQYSSGSSSYILRSFGVDKMNGGNNDIAYVNGIMTENGVYPY